MPRNGQSESIAGRPDYSALQGKVMITKVGIRDLNFLQLRKVVNEPMLSALEEYIRLMRSLLVLNCNRLNVLQTSEAIVPQRTEGGK